MGKNTNFNPDSPVEVLRVERTPYNQDEFAVRCGIPRSTYQRWVSGTSEARPTLRQIKNMARLLGIERIEELPDSFSPEHKLLPEKN